MKLKQAVIGGLAAFAVAGCVSKLHKVEDGVIATPKYCLGSAAKEEKTYAFYSLEALKVDRNKDKKIDLVEINIYPHACRGLNIYEGPQRILLIDSNFDGYPDFVYTDVLSTDFSAKADGKYDLKQDAKLFYLENALENMGKAREDMLIEDYMRNLWFSEIKEDIKILCDLKEETK